MSNSKFSICLPWVYHGTSEKKVYSVFKNLGCGTIDNIHFLEAGDHQIVFVNFSDWSTDEASTEMREALENGEQVQVVYDEPWYWKVSMCRKREKKQHAKPYVKFGPPEPKEEKAPEEPKAADEEGWTTAKKKRIIKKK